MESFAKYTVSSKDLSCTDEDLVSVDILNFYDRLLFPFSLHSLHSRIQLKTVVRKLDMFLGWREAQDIFIDQRINNPLRIATAEAEHLQDDVVNIVGPAEPTVMLK